MTRRAILYSILLAPPALRQLRASTHNQFWNTKDAADWNEKENTEILTHSPWAKHAETETKTDLNPIAGREAEIGGRPPGAGGGMGAGGGAGGGGGLNGISPEARGGGDAGAGAPPKPQMDILIRWESAAPVSAALKRSPSSEAAQSYVIGMSGLPLHAPDANHKLGIEEGFKQATSLQRKGKDPILPDKVEFIDQIGKSSLRFSFPRDPHPITSDDKDVTFLSTLGRMTIKAKFSLKDMTYHDQLSL